MKSLKIKKKDVKVGDIIEAMYISGDFDNVSHLQLTDVVHAFLREYVGMPGSIITKKFTKDSAVDFSNRFKIPVETVVKIITVFRISAGKEKGVKSKLMKSYGKHSIKGGIKSGVSRKL